jgi:DNA-binding transcriptional LysR family regulator
LKFTLRQLEYFSVLSEHQTLSAAAAALHVSESTLSHSLTDLEKSVGVQLCQRIKARGLSLTPAGRYFADRARALIREATELGNETSTMEGHLKGPVQLGCFAGVANNVLPTILEGFPKIHPGVSIELTVGTDDDLLPRLYGGKLDFVILYDMLLPPSLQRCSIYDTEVTAVVPGSHRFASRQSIALADLADEPFIMVDSRPSTENTSRIFRDQGIVPRRSVSVPLVELAKARVGRGLGYTLLMSRPNSTNLTTEGLEIAVRPLAPRAGLTSVVAVWPEGFQLTPRARALMDYAAGRLRPNLQGRLPVDLD